MGVFRVSWVSRYLGYGLGLPAGRLGRSLKADISEGLVNRSEMVADGLDLRLGTPPTDRQF